MSSRKDIFYELENLSEIKDRTILKLFETDGSGRGAGIVIIDIIMITISFMIILMIVSIMISMIMFMIIIPILTAPTTRTFWPWSCRPAPLHADTLRGRGSLSEVTNMGGGGCGDGGGVVVVTHINKKTQLKKGVLAKILNM